MGKIQTDVGEVDEERLVKRPLLIDDEREYTTGTEYLLDGKVVRCDRHVRPKLGAMSLANAVMGRLDQPLKENE